MVFHCWSFQNVMASNQIILIQRLHWQAADKSWLNHGVQQRLQTQIMRETRLIMGSEQIQDYTKYKRTKGPLKNLAV